MTRIGIIHTTPVTIEPLKALAQERLPGAEVLNWVDDSILPELARNSGDLRAVEERLLYYTRFAEQAGSDVILHACSSVGELVARAQQVVDVPVIRIDQAMATEAVRRGRRIGVAATLATTLNPTLALLREQAAEAGRDVTLVPTLVDAAYQRLLAGDSEGHDAVLAERLGELAREVEVVVLAQASMARVLSRLPERQRDRFLTSPPLAMTQLQQIVEQQTNAKRSQASEENAGYDSTG